MEEVLIHAEGLVKTFGEIRAVDGISLSVRRGEVLGFLGPNGAGKTTTMKMLTGFLEPSAGRAEIAGHDIV
ncbi:MAG: ATP-binding cassette domain-containing protein, partial [Alphaproteobacteria bacterium]